MISCLLVYPRGPLQTQTQPCLPPFHDCLAHYIEPQTLTPIAINPTNAGENALPSPGDVSAPPSPEIPMPSAIPVLASPQALRHPPRAVTSTVELFTGCSGDPLNAPSCWVVHNVVHNGTSIQNNANTLRIHCSVNRRQYLQMGHIALQSNSAYPGLDQQKFPLCPFAPLPLS
ncbi:hypothetical protein CCHR01_13614 [Colletotrichum chrysophilum]|uniref:Uncharacterized protein n=1 Tax=Colletotrichum chrysophilum TaxID=1836956 RepID=A0AAD9A9U2_9PEZI|nr:hypothetical protein CCHR01_13614 [Colletotrichum chrysophilum]